jgi:tetratricopeptide (TPR) repeat protein
MVLPQQAKWSGFLKNRYLNSVVASCIIFSTIIPQIYAEPTPDPRILQKADALFADGDGTSAKAVYLATWQTYPQTANAAIGLAKIAMREYDYPTARDYLEQALAVAPERADILAEMARLFHLWTITPIGTREDYHGRAAEYFRLAEMVQNDNLVYLTYFGEWQLDEGDTVSAEKLFRHVITQDSTYVPAYQGLARVYMKLRDLRQAKDIVLQAFELDPENTTSYFQMAELLAQANHPEKAIQYALKSDQLDFGILPARDLLLAQEYERLGDLRNALQWYEAINGYAPNQSAILIKMAELAELVDDPVLSQKYFEQAFEADPSVLQRWIDKAQDDLRTEKVAAALQRFRRILTTQPGNEAALHGIASAQYLSYFYQNNNPAEAQADLTLFDANTLSLNETGLSPLLAMDRIKLRIAAQNEPFPAGVALYQEALEVISQSNSDLAAGEALFMLGRFREGQERLDAFDGETAEGYLYAGDRLMLSGELTVSHALYQRGYELSPLPALQEGVSRIMAKQKLAEQRINEGNHLFDQKQYREAAQKYQQASWIYQEWETPYLRLGDAYEVLKEKNLAKTAFQKAVSLNPGLLESKGFAKKYKKYEH